MRIEAVAALLARIADRDAAEAWCRANASEQLAERSLALARATDCAFSGDAGALARAHRVRVALGSLALTHARHLDQRSDEARAAAEAARIATRRRDLICQGSLARRRATVEHEAALDRSSNMARRLLGQERVDHD